MLRKEVIQAIGAIVHELDPTCPFNGRVVPVPGLPGLHSCTDPRDGTTYISQEAYDLLVESSDEDRPPRAPGKTYVQ